MLVYWLAINIGQTRLSLWPKISALSLVFLLSACGGGEGGTETPITSSPIEETDDPLPEDSNTPEPIDDETPDPNNNEGVYQVSLTVANSIVTEGSSATLTFSLSKINDTSEVISIYYTLSGSSDTGIDYQELAGRIDIAANTASTLFTLNTLDDSIVESTESILISLSAQSLPDNITLAENSSVEISIRDNDSVDKIYDLTTRAGSQDFYNDEYLASAFDDNNWSGGNQSTCNEGSIPSDVKDKTTQRLNYFRTLVGVNNIDHDVNLNAKAQKGGHVSQIQFDLGVTLTSAFHVPSNENGDWVCLDEDAREAMGSSSIAQVGSSWNAADTVDLFVWDPGVNNSSAGHRDNLFRSDLNAVGIGATDEAVLIMTENTGNPTGMWTWPPALYVPKEILYDWSDYSRWSVRHEKAFLKWKNKEANGSVTPVITVTNCDGGNISVQNIKIADNKLLTWEVASGAESIVNECEYQVSITDYYLVEEEGDGAATGSLSSFNYALTIFNAE